MNGKKCKACIVLWMCLVLAACGSLTEGENERNLLETEHSVTQWETTEPLTTVAAQQETVKTDRDASNDEETISLPSISTAVETQTHPEEEMVKGSETDNTYPSYENGGIELPDHDWN